MGRKSKKVGGAGVVAEENGVEMQPMTAHDTGAGLSNAEKKKLRKERRKVKRSKTKLKYERLADNAKASLLRSRSEATTILLEGLESSEWDLINDSINGFVPPSRENNGLLTRSEPFNQKFCRWFELVSLTALSVMAVLSFAYFGYRYQPPYEVCVCADRRLRDCSLIDPSASEAVAACLVGASIDTLDETLFYRDSSCAGEFPGDGYLSMEPWADISGRSACFRTPYLQSNETEEFCLGTCYVMNEFLARDDPLSTVDRKVRDTYGLPEYDARWVEPFELNPNYGYPGYGGNFTHMWAFAGTYPNYVSTQKAYFFAVVSIFGTLLSVISYMEAIKGYDPNKKHASLIALAITLVLSSLFVFSVYILVDDHVWTDRYLSAVQSLQKVLTTKNPSYIHSMAQFVPPTDVDVNAGINPPNDVLILRSEASGGGVQIVQGFENWPFTATRELVEQAHAEGHIAVEEAALVGLLARSWLPYIIEPCLNFLQIADPQSAADLVVGLDITSNECQCVGLECLQCPNRTAGLANELELYGPDGVCNASVAGDWVCAADAPSADCQLATDPLRINFGNLTLDRKMTITTQSVPVMALLILFAAIRYVSVIAFSIRVLRYKADQCYNCHTGFNAGKWPYKCKQCGYNFCETCLAHERLLAADEAHVREHHNTPNIDNLKAIGSKIERSKLAADREHGRIAAMVCGSCFQKTPANTLNSLAFKSMSQNASEGMQLLTLFHYDDCVRSWRLKRAKELRIDVSGTDEHGVERIDTVVIEPPSREYMLEQVLQRVRRETGVFWYTGLDKVMHRAVSSLFDYYERNGGKATFKSILGERKKSDNSVPNESPAQYMRRQLAVIFPRNFEREMNAVIALDSVQQTEYKELLRRSTQALAARKGANKVTPLDIAASKKTGGDPGSEGAAAAAAVGAVPEPVNLEILQFDLLPRKPPLTHVLHEGSVLDLVARGDIPAADLEEISACKEMLLEFWKMSHNDQGDATHLLPYMSPLGSLYPTFTLYMGISSHISNVNHLPPRAELAPLAVFTKVQCRFFAPVVKKIGAVNNAKHIFDCDVFVFTDYVLFFEAKNSTSHKLGKKTYRCKSGEQLFLLLREDVGRVEEQGTGAAAKLVLFSGAHSQLHSLRAPEDQMDILVETMYIWLSPVNFSANSAAALRRVANVRPSQNPLKGHSDVDEVEDIPADGEEGALVVPDILNPQTTYECALRKAQVVKFFTSGQEYFRVVAKAIEAAQECIFIASESVAPELYLVRDAGILPDYRLGVLLQRKARCGVQIHITLAKSKYTDYIGGRFELLHENVIVTIVENDRPGQSWTAHQNQVVVDSTVAFVGGISLFFGQFERLVDTPMSHLNAPNKCGKQSDPLPAPAEQRPFQQGQSQFQYPLSDVAERFFPGSSYVNPQESGGMHTLHLLEWPFFSQGIFSDSHARLCTPRLPNSHVMVAVIGQAAEDVARSFITVWNSQELNFRSTIEGEPPARLIRLAPVNMPSMRPEIYRSVLEAEDDTGLVGVCEARCLRSMSPWCGFANIEASIHQQMVHLIRSSERSIHIETSCFISFVNPQNKVHNRIARALYDRIATAIEQEQDFHVVLQLPTQPPELIEELSTLSQMVFSQLSLYQGQNSLLHRLQQRYFTETCVSGGLAQQEEDTPLNKLSVKGKRISDFLTIVTMYKWELFSDRHKYTGYKANPRAQFLKPSNFVAVGVNTTGTTMIVDDKIAVVGSHGISDRGLLGNRNGEFGVVLNDMERRTVASGYLGNQTAVVGTTVHRLRMHLWNRLLGLPLGDTRTTSNMLAREVRLLLKHTANRNAAIFHRVFPSLPHGSYRTLQQFNWAILKKRDLRPSEEQGALFLREVRGTVCSFPVQFLVDEDPEGIIGPFGTSISKAQLEFV